MIKMSKIFIYFVFVAIISAIPFEGISETALETRINEELDNYVETKKVGSFLKDLVEELDLKGLFSSYVQQGSWKEPKLTKFCSICRVGVNRILALNSTDLVFNETIALCIDLEIGNQIFCESIVRTNQPTIVYIADHVEDETGSDICGVIFVGRGCTTNDPRREWSVTLPSVTKPPISEPPYPQNPPSTLKILHLADTHYDPKYMPGSNAQCPEVFFCCNAESGIVENPEDAAGYWGDYRYCDVPIWTLEAMYQSINEDHPDIDLIIWTGDLVPHILWDTERQNNIEIISQMAQLLRTYFPGVPVFPAIGNHEASPVNLFSQPYVQEEEFNMAWLYVELANLWSYWLPPDTVKDILFSAYYSTPIRTGLRVVSINTNWCYGNNWWLIYDSTDIADELDYLAKELQKAEDDGEFVYIIGHHPPGYQDCQRTWSREFNRILFRYEDTVTGMFFGHTHHDHYELFFDPENTTRVYDIAYIGQSQTPYSELNPGYKVYTVEGDFEGSRFRVLDHDNYILDLDEANRSNVTDFFRLYRASEEYGLSDLSPQSWLDLVDQMVVPNSTVFDTFYRNYVKAGTPSMEKGCSEGCKNHILCRILTSDNSDPLQCKEAGLD